MTVKIGNIGKYTLFPGGMALNLVGEEKRKVRLEVNCEYETRFDVVQDGTVIFLAKVEGHANIEFVVEGPAVVQPTSEGEVWLSTDEGPHLVYESDAPSFVTLDFERTELSAFERMQAIANLRREQREQETEELLAELRQRKAELEALEKANEPEKEPANAGDGGDAAPEAGDSGQSEQAGAGQAKPAGSAKSVPA